MQLSHCPPATAGYVAARFCYWLINVENGRTKKTHLQSHSLQEGRIILRHLLKLQQEFFFRRPRRFFPFHQFPLRLLLPQFLLPGKFAFGLLPLFQDLLELTDRVLDNVLEEEDPVVIQSREGGIRAFEPADPKILKKNID